MASEFQVGFITKVSPKQIILLASIGTLLFSITVVLGWLLDLPMLSSVLPSHESMKINTAILFILAAIGTLFLLRKKYKYVVFWLSIIIILGGSATLAEHIFTVDLAIDEVIVKDSEGIMEAAPNLAPGRPSPVTAMSFLIFGSALALLLTDSDVNATIGQFSFNAITIMAFIIVLAYIYNIDTLIKSSIFTSMSLSTSLTFLVLSISASLHNAQLGITGLFNGRQIGNLMIRTIFPKILTSVMVLGYIYLQLYRKNIISVEMGIFLLGTSFILVTLYILFTTSSLLNRIDIKRQMAENQLAAINKNLEKTIVHRTQDLTRQNEQLQDFAHIVSHNLREPTANLSTLLAFYKKEDSKNEKRFLLDKFEVTIDNLEETLSELLKVVGIRNKSLEHTKVLKFEKILLEVMADYTQKISTEEAIITYDFSKAETMEYSAQYLKNILDNLLSNALKYRSPQRRPHIHFQTLPNQDKVMLSVSDNGLGIDMQRNGHRIFGLQKTFHKHPEARGVGLFIIKAQIEAMGGEIYVESEVNKGSCFKIIF